MAKSSSSTKKRKLSKTPETRKPNKKKPEKAPAHSDSSDSDSESQSDKLHKLLEPYSKDQLIDFLTDAALSDPTLLRHIRSTADLDVSHRKIFVHGLAWDTTRDTLISAFEPYGPIEDCNVVVDKLTGKAKGYGFVLFKSRSAASKALKQPQKKINNRPAYCQLASVGPAPLNQAHDSAGRKIYVSNVHADADRDKLRTFFARFGEIETGPLGFDTLSGKSRGFALFVYKTQEGAKKALEEPYKMFEGHQLHCQKAAESSQKSKAMAFPQQLVPGPAALAAAAAAQNMALFMQNPSLNPALSALLANPSTGLIPRPVNPLVAAAAGPAVNAGIGAAQLGGAPAVGSASYGVSSHGLGSVGGSSLALGSYSSQASAALQELQSYQKAHLGQSSGGRTYPTGGSLSGLPPYV
ncbi:UBP1-associated protein 2B-like isoform X2 [Magnolia sinica]|uniref:UBP1-associated protein 2B-like isoform X2 n=1 Tax=Magnolia sinica TaxID=86752 RepID=UPI00265A0E74|nr:UBP1-associated protein 2B-like isoform X2 [Magnolia sinica]